MLGSSQREGTPTGRMQWQVLRAGGGRRTLAAPSCPPSPCLPADLSAPDTDTEGQAPQGAWAPALHPRPLRAAPSLGSTGDMHSAGSRSRGDTHQTRQPTEPRSGQPPLPPGGPAPWCSLFGLHPTCFLGGRGARAATASLGSLCGRLLDLGRRARGDTPRPLPHPAPGLQLWDAAPRAEARPWATTVLPLLGQVNNCCCF